MTTRAARRLPGHSGTVPVVGFLLLALLGVLVFGFSPTMNPIDLITGNIGAVETPKIVGLTQTRGLIELERAHVHGKVSFGFSSTFGPGIVMEQTPKPGDPLDRGGTARVVVSRGAGQVLLPDFSGMPERDATRQIDKANLTSKVERANDETVAKGSVVSQDPAPGIVVIGGSTVRITVSLGPAERVVPAVSGLPVEGAAFLIGKAGFTIGVITRSDNATVVRDAVVGTDPPSGASAARDAPVNLVVSDGRPPVAVPDVTKILKDAAVSQLGKLGFVVGEVTQLGPIGDPADNQVITQNPAPGTMLRPGDAVSITVRHAARPTTTVAPTTTAAPTTAAPPTAPPAAAPPPKAPGT